MQWVLLSLLTVAASSGLGAQNPDPFALSRAAAELRREGRPAQAAALYQQALQALDRTPAGESQRPALLHQTAQALLESGDPARAAQLARRAVALDAASGGPTDASATFRGTLGAALLAEGQARDAAIELQASLAIRERLLGVNDPALAGPLSNLAMAYRMEDRLEEAAQIYQRALAILTAGPQAAEWPVLTHNLGRVRAAQGRAREAEHLFRDAVSAWEARLGPDHPDVAAGLSSLGQILSKEGRNAEARRVLERARRINAAAYPAGHPRRGRDAKDAGEAAAAAKNYQEAEAYLIRAVAILEAAAPTDRPDLGGALASLADVERRRKKPQLSAQHYQRALTLLTQAWGANDRRLLPLFGGYAAVLRATEDYVGAARADMQATRIRVILALH